MDVLSCIDKAYKAMKLIKKTIDDVKDAPDSLQLLRLRASYIEALLNELDRLPARFLSEAEDRADLQRFAAIAAKSVEEVEDFLAKVLRSGKNGDRKVNKARFLQSKAFGSNIEDLSTKLDSLQKTLTLMCDIVTLRSKSQATTAPSQSEVLLEEVATALRRVDITMSALSVRTSIPAPRLITPTSHNRLRCLVGCECRCHSPGTSQVVTSWLTPYVGKVNVPKQRPCDVQTCRQDRTMPSHAVWYLPLWMAKVEAQISSPFYLSIRTPRMVRGDAQIWHSIWEADIAGVRGLLLSGEASVLDVNEQGWTVLRWAQHSCEIATRSSAKSGRDRASFDMIKFLADAGADLEFCASDYHSVKHAIAMSSLGTLIEQPDAVFAHQVKTSALNVELCQSIFHTGAIDLVEDLLEWRGIQADSDPVAAVLFGYSSNTACTLSDVFRRLTGWTALEYAVAYHPNHVESLLRRGEDATVGCPLAMAADSGNITIIKPLVEAGARVNAYHYTGMTALHHACQHLNTGMLKTLIQYAGQDGIDWGAFTRGGKSALRVAESSPFCAMRSTSEVEEFFDTLRAHIPQPSEELRDSDEPVQMPGSFT